MAKDGTTRSISMEIALLDTKSETRLHESEEPPESVQAKTLVAIYELAPDAEASQPA
jgi:hypothetical protein